MNSNVGMNKENLVWNSLWGVARGLFVHTLTYPLQVIKIRQQCSQGEPMSLRTTIAHLRQEGIGAFYKGLPAQLVQTSIKQIWRWPMMTGIPSVLERYRIENLQQQALTGFSIATADAAISAPLERAKIISAFRGTNIFCLKTIYREGWRGFGTHWSELSVYWVVFLTAQKYLRDQAYAQSEQPLSLFQLTKIGIKVALIVSLASAPFDAANTLKQAQNQSASEFLSRKGIYKMFRGLPVNGLSHIIGNIAYVIIIDRTCRS